MAVAVQVELILAAKQELMEIMEDQAVAVQLKVVSHQ
jgi:hypothetical protein